MRKGSSHLLLHSRITLKIGRLLHLLLRNICKCAISLYPENELKYFSAWALKHFSITRIGCDILFFCSSITLLLNQLQTGLSYHKLKDEVSGNFFQLGVFQHIWCKGLASYCKTKLSLFISLLLMPNEAFDNVKIDKWKVKVVLA